MVYIKQVKIQDFKNFTTETVFNFENGTNILVGKNGTGKTGVLDAIIWALTSRLYNGSQQGWKPKELYVDSENNAMSKVKDLFNTVVEVTIGFDDGQKDIVIKRTSCCGKSTVLYYNGITDTQKQVNKYLEKALGFDMSKLLIYTNPEILFNPDEVSQQECGKLIFDAVRHSVKQELENLYEHLFDDYENIVSFLEENSLEKTIANKVLSNTKKSFAKDFSENEIIEETSKFIDDNLEILNTKTETIKSQELILNDYYQKLKQEKTYKDLEAKLDKQEQLLRSKLFERGKLKEELTQSENSRNELIVWLNDFNELLQTNPSNDQIKVAFGLEVANNVDKSKINSLKKEAQKVKCPVCGNWYIPKPEIKKDSILTKLNNPDQQKTEQKQESAVFDYLPKLNEIKKQISDLKDKIFDLSNKIDAIDKVIKTYEYHSVEQLQEERNNVSKYFASLDQGKNIQKQVTNMKQDCEECSLNNKYLNIILETIKLYVKQKLQIIMKKLNQNLSSGIISLFKLQTNGTLKECVTILDKSSYASYAETNQSSKIKLGIEVCKLLQDFNNINIPILIDEVGRFNNYDFIRTLGHQIIATLPTDDDQVLIRR